VGLPGWWAWICSVVRPVLSYSSKSGCGNSGKPFGGYGFYGYARIAGPAGGSSAPVNSHP
jgi:hypothetical protein